MFHVQCAKTWTLVSTVSCATKAAGSRQQAASMKNSDRCTFSGNNPWKKFMAIIADLLISNQPHRVKASRVLVDSDFASRSRVSTASTGCDTGWNIRHVCYGNKQGGHWLVTVHDFLRRSFHWRLSTSFYRRVFDFWWNSPNRIFFVPLHMDRPMALQ